MAEGSTSRAVHQPSYAEKVAAKLIEQLEQGTAPWQRPWAPGELALPFNPTTGAQYRGGNAVWLLAQGQADPRWMTYKQATAAGGQVRKGEHGTVIQFVKTRGQEPVRDESGAPVLEDGKPKTQTVQYERPRVFSAVVFNAAQIDNLPPLAPREKVGEWERQERCEAILQASGVPIAHVHGAGAFYEPGRDRITLPAREQFPKADGYYATALHELGHATGHPSRLDRDLAHPFGSEGYAREELRAEIASLMLGQELGIGHDPGHHAAYVASWIKALQEDPREVFRAAADSEKITAFVLGLEKQRSLDDHEPALKPDEAYAAAIAAEQRFTAALERAYGANAADQRYQLQHSDPEVAKAAAEKIAADRMLHDTLTAARQAPQENRTMITKQRINLTVPFADKDLAKAAGARYDTESKTWFAPSGANLDPLERWIPGRNPAPTPNKDPKDEFADALREAGLQLDRGQWIGQTRLSDSEPIMDGKRYRVPVDGDKGPERSGMYVGYSDGHPAGYIQNFRTGQRMNWKSSGKVATVSETDRARLNEEAAQKLAAREAAQAAEYARTAAALERFLTHCEPASLDHKYLRDKGLSVAPLAVPKGLSQLDTDPPVHVAETRAQAATIRKANPDAIVFHAGDLVIPVTDLDGNLQSVQSISDRGFKSNANGGKLAGGCAILDPIENRAGPASAIIIAEGWATGETLHQATGAMVVCAFSSGNLKQVAQAVHEKWPDRPKLIAGDNDHVREHEIDARTGQPRGNPGRKAAEEAAEAIGAYAAVPRFDKGSKGTDWNDFAKESGEDQLKKSMDESLILADRRRLEDAQRTGHDAERVAADIQLHAGQVQARQVKAKGMSPAAAADTAAAAEDLRMKAEHEADRQDTSDEVPPPEQTPTRKRAGRSRSR